MHTGKNMSRKTELGVQTAVRLPQDVYDRLKKSEHGVSEEIRRRLARTFAEDDAGTDPETRRLMDAIEKLAVLVRLQTNHNWHSHPAAHWVMRNAITARLQRLRPSGERVFAPGELPDARLVTSDDPEAMGLGLEAVEFHRLPLNDEQKREIEEKIGNTIRLDRVR
jgi:hypothetical protein